MGLNLEATLRQRFAAELPENYIRRIIFWQDPDREFEQFVDELCPDGVKLLKLTGTNNFAAKMLLSESDPDSNYLVYNPISYSDMKDDWLLDIELYSEEFRADLVSIRMQELNIPDRPQMRKAIKSYSRFFANKARVAKLSGFQSDYAAVGQLHIDIMAVLSESRANTAPDIIRAVLMHGLELGSNEAIRQIKKFGNETAWWELVGRYTGYAHQDEEDSLFPLIGHILLTALSVTMKAPALHGLEKWISDPHQQMCYSLVHEWMYSENGEALYDLARDVEDQLGLAERFDNLDVAELADSDCFPCIDECILRHYMMEISDNVVKAAEITATVERRRTLKWYERVRYYFDGLLQVAQMYDFFQRHADGFHVARYDVLWKNYCGDYCKMDHDYRLFHASFSKSLKESSTRLDDLYKNVADYAERLYKNWYLAALGKQWTNLASEELTGSAVLPGIRQQVDFYKSYIAPIIASGSRAYVIVSDALRYEVGVDLAGQLLRETKGTAKISSMQAVIPTVTKFGMAALLPHQELRLTRDMNVTCDNLPTVGTENRAKVLQGRHSGNVAITYKALLSMKQAERREIIADAQTVYIYHNAIDAVGDKALTEDQVFAACEQAILEIKNLVRMIVNHMNGTNILITSDHGFLYSYQPLEESDKLGRSVLPEDILELERRYVIAKQIRPAEHMVQIPMSHMSSDLYAYVPLDTIRIKKSGGGMNYVHGGISLQELVVPVIEYKNVRPTSKNYVDVRKAGLQLISQSRKVSNSIFSLDFYQPEPVGGKVTEATYEICMTDAKGKIVSDKKTIIADKTSKDGAERVFRVRLTLKSEEYRKTDTYYLMITEKGASGCVERIEFSIDIAFVNDFDF